MDEAGDDPMVLLPTYSEPEIETTIDRETLSYKIRVTWKPSSEKHLVRRSDVVAALLKL